MDTANRDSNAMEMMPIVNLFNEWHAANTSKKIRAVKKSNATEGIYTANKAIYGYVMGTDKKRTPVIDEEAAAVVRRIFEMYASGLSPKKIAEIFDEECIPSPGVYAHEKYGKKLKHNALNIWHKSTIREMLNNMIYIGHMPQLRWTSLSYKNKKRYRKDESEWTIIYNTHEPIISKELWDKVHERMKSVSHGRTTKQGYTHPLSEFLYCADCGQKMKLATHKTKKGSVSYCFNCGHFVRYGKRMCSSHYMSAKDLTKLILDDIREMAFRIEFDKDAVREDFLRQNEELADKAVKSAKKEIQTKKNRVVELSRLMQIAYEDRMKGKMPEELCFGFIQKYSDEQKTLSVEIAELEANLTETENKQQSVDDFIRNIKKYLYAPELTREMCYELLYRVVVGGLPKSKDEPRKIDIVYKVDLISVMRNRRKK